MKTILCSLRWLRPSLSLVINLIPLGLRISKTEFGEGRMKNNLHNDKHKPLLSVQIKPIPSICLLILNLRRTPYLIARGDHRKTIKLI